MKMDNKYLIIPISMILMLLVRFFEPKENQERGYIKYSLLTGLISGLSIFLFNNGDINVIEDMIPGPADF